MQKTYNKIWDLLIENMKKLSSNRKWDIANLRNFLYENLTNNCLCTGEMSEHFPLRVQTSTKGKSLVKRVFKEQLLRMSKHFL